MCFRKTPLYVGVDDGQKTATVEGLEQGYCLVPADLKLRLLFTFLKKNKGKKVRCCSWCATETEWMFSCSFLDFNTRSFAEGLFFLRKASIYLQS